jgi:hypothetical protein
MSQVSAEVVDWGWLLSFPDRRSRVDALLGSGEAAAHTEACEDLVEDWTDSGIMRFETSDGLDTLIGDSDSATAALLRRAFSPLLSNENGAAIDELELASASSGCFYASLSPAVAADAAQALAGLDLAAVAKELDPTRQEEFREYLEQWAAVIRRASERGMGIVAHEG